MKKHFDSIEFKNDLAGHLAALSFGIQSLLLTGVFRLWQHPGDEEGLRFLSLITGFSFHFFLIVIIVLALIANAAWLIRHKMNTKGSAVSILALLVGLNPVLIWMQSSASFLLVHNITTMILACVLALDGIRKPRTMAARGISVVLGMIIFDLASDMPFLLAGISVDVSYLNNTIHNGTLVHKLWLPLSLGIIGLGVGLALYKKQGKALWWLIPLLALGGILLYGVVEPKEAVLAQVAVDSARTAELLHPIALAHLTSFIILLIGVWLLYLKDKVK